MAALKLGIAYFSATGVTDSYAHIIQEATFAYGCTVQLFNVTTHSARQYPLPISDFDAFIFGFPVFADFAPRVINEWISTLDGKGKRCSLYFTYGGRTTGYAHFHTKLLLENAGFQVISSAEFLGRHSFNVCGWNILPNRPHEEDFSVARKYAAVIHKRLLQETPVIFTLQKPFGYNQIVDLLKNEPKASKRSWCNPVRTVEKCRMCRTCENQCPASAFNAETGLSDPEKCISCLHCVYICPDNVIKTDEQMKYYCNDFLANWHVTEEMMNKKRSKIITEPEHAVS